MDTTENKFILTLCIEENVFGFFKSQTNIFSCWKKKQNVGKFLLNNIFLSDYIFGLKNIVTGISNHLHNGSLLRVSC